jgi:hypothetical protein
MPGLETLNELSITAGFPTLPKSLLNAGEEKKSYNPKSTMRPGSFASNPQSALSAWQGFNTKHLTIETSHYTMGYTDLSELIVRDSITNICSSGARVFGLPNGLHIPVARAITDRHGGAGVF